MRAFRGKLVSQGSQRGTPVHAAALIRRREIIIETDLLARPRLFSLILVHEIFHFVWARLGNKQRAGFAELLAREQEAYARGELGESAEVAKQSIRAFDRERSPRAWRNYVCESFCDTAACLYGGAPRHAGFTLAKRWKRKREKWFHLAFERGCRC